MSFSKEALQLIVDNALLAAGHLPDTDNPVAYLPEGARVVDMEQFQAGRSRFRGTLSTTSLADFAGYVIGRQLSKPAAAFVDPETMRCRAFFNLGDATNPGHADDTALLALKPTAAYAALQAIAGQRLSQKDLAEWMEDWRLQLRVTDEHDQDMGTALAIAAVRDITIKASAERTHTESNFGANRSAMDAIEAKSRQAMPGTLFFSCAPYEGLGISTFELRLSVLTGEDKPALRLRWVGEEAQREEIAQEFKTVLAREIGAAATLTLGTFAPGN